MATPNPNSPHPSKAKAWIEAVRLRTLPASLAGVVAGCGCAAYYQSFSWPQAVICFLFALLAQIASNFANEYYDYKNGLDKKGREGFRRGVTEGDIKASQMKTATFSLLAVDALLGCSLIYWGGWWLIPIGIAIAIFAIAYSAGPYPLSHHGLGDIAVFIFFGVVPVVFTAYVQSQSLNILPIALPVGAAIGLQCANILIVNNYRDADDDKSVGKHTTVVIFGRKTMGWVYLFNGLAALVLLVCVVDFAGAIWEGAIFVLPAVLHVGLYKKIRIERGHSLNPLLGKTAMLLLFESIATTAILAAMGCR